MASDRVFVRNGRIFYVEHKEDDDSPIVTIKRSRDWGDFLSDKGSPDEYKLKGTLDELTAEFDTTTQELYRRLFSLKNASWNAIRSVGANGFIEFLPNN